MVFFYHSESRSLATFRRDNTRTIFYVEILGHYWNELFYIAYTCLNKELGPICQTGFATLNYYVTKLGWFSPSIRAVTVSKFFRWWKCILPTIIPVLLRYLVHRNNVTYGCRTMHRKHAPHAVNYLLYFVVNIIVVYVVKYFVIRVVVKRWTVNP